MFENRSHVLDNSYQKNIEMQPMVLNGGYLGKANFYDYGISM